MLSFRHGNGISMKSISEFKECKKNEIANNELINLSNRLEDLINFNAENEFNIKNNTDFFIKLDFKDNYLFDKIEQIINSFEETNIIVIDNNIFITANEFKQNENPSTILFSYYYDIYWFLRNSLLREIYKYSLKTFENTSNNSISFDKIEFVPKDVPNKIKNIKKFEQSLM